MLDIELEHHNTNSFARWHASFRDHPRQGPCPPIVQIEI